jgi:hypothetical protein
VNRLFGTSYTDLCHGDNAFWARCLPALQVDCDGFEDDPARAPRGPVAGGPGAGPGRGHRRAGGPAAIGSAAVRAAGMPLLRNAYALLAGSVLTALLGLGYLVLAARRYPAAEVGRGSATIATMTWLSTIAVLNVPGSLTRYLPRAGRQAGRLVLRRHRVPAGAGRQPLRPRGQRLPLRRLETSTVLNLLAVNMAIYRRGSDSALCGPDACPRYRRRWPWRR